MIGRLLAISAITFITNQMQSQTYGNEWINYSQNYYKIKIAQDGIYRIDSATLAAAGISCGLGGINPRNFQLFNKGIQQSIYVQGESDNVFNNSDFIEFYGQKNDGSLDSLLYVNTAFVPNPYYSLINDTAVYFLTWNASVSNKRMQVESATPFSPYVPDTYFFNDLVEEYHNGYYEGETDDVGGTDSRYTCSEGWFDNVVTLGNSVSHTINTPNKYLGGPSSIIKSVVIGASKDIGIIGNDHELEFKYNGIVLTDTMFKGYASNRGV